MLFKQVADAFAASRQWDSASLSRLAFWVECSAIAIISEVTIDEVDDAIVRLAERGRLRGGRRRTVRSGQAAEGRHDQSLRLHARFGLSIRASRTTRSAHICAADPRHRTAA